MFLYYIGKILKPISQAVGKGVYMKKWVMLLAAGIAFSANSATLIPEQGISVLYINGVETEKSLGKQQLNPGETEIIIRFDKKFGRGNSEKLYTSAPYVVNFSVSGEEIRLKHPTARSYKEAEAAFNDIQPQWTITQDGQTISYKQEVLPPKKGLFPYLGMDTLVADYYNNKNNEVTQQQAVVATDTSAPDASNLTQLQAWYLKSSAEERKAFRRWMIDQE